MNLVKKRKLLREKTEEIQDIDVKEIELLHEKTEGIQDIDVKEIEIIRINSLFYLSSMLSHIHCKILPLVYIHRPI